MPSTVSMTTFETGSPAEARLIEAMRKLNEAGVNPLLLEAERREYQRRHREYLRRTGQAEVYESDETYAHKIETTIYDYGDSIIEWPSGYWRSKIAYGPPVQPEYVPEWPFDEWGTLHEERPEGENLC